MCVCVCVCVYMCVCVCVCVCMCVCVCVCVISSQRPKTVGVDYSCIEYMRNIILIYVSTRCMPIVTSHISLQIYNKTHIQSVYSAIRRKLKPD